MNTTCTHTHMHVHTTNTHATNTKATVYWTHRPFFVRGILWQATLGAIRVSKLEQAAIQHKDVWDRISRPLLVPPVLSIFLEHV